MSTQLAAVACLALLGGIVAAGLAFGGLSGEAAWGFLGGVVGLIGGILAPSPKGS